MHYYTFLIQLLLELLSNLVCILSQAQFFFKTIVKNNKSSCFPEQSQNFIQPNNSIQQISWNLFSYTNIFLYFYIIASYKIITIQIIFHTDMNSISIIDQLPNQDVSFIWICIQHFCEINSIVPQQQNSRFFWQILLQINSEYSQKIQTGVWMGLSKAISKNFCNLFALALIYIVIESMKSKMIMHELSNLKDFFAVITFSLLFSIHKSKNDIV
ncbi:unnamed protein product (macronuclear) [Paramecium tetraurelia]|uniref:Transmembrane protein n=1 Tax=Paramecium tetraurelia TaxID=5888 RepID=A0C2E0_PARTE|nr:uncharacterized protein GSPATT00034435001 [Paramecium tetraurelia]CAK64957.1 unnamed protein product [Paramecium tetraurelia]|eukprot:XP_001432354.1 hypothetical protein (macronuclear) [Paramecium tetraurelia strain d4-2]